MPNRKENKWGAMITPQPEADMSLNILIVAADVIKILFKNNEMTVDGVLKEFMIKDNRRTHRLFYDTLTFLFILGILEESNYIVRIKHGYTQKTLF